jgi:glycosyltransferase involved in cell wall biosynthesis
LIEKSLLLIGGKGFLENRLKRMVGKFALEEVIHFLGYIPDEDLPKFYQASDYFVLPTKDLEGFGLVILESMACGTPVLGTPIGAIPEVIGAFRRELVFDGTDSRDIKEKLEDVFKKSDDYNFSQEECRKFVEDYYSWEKVGDMFEKEMEEIVAERH